MPRKTLISWSGGKDSALALLHARRDPRCRVAHLLTSVNAVYGRVSMHGVRVELLLAQARRLGLPLTQLPLPETTTMADYEQALLATLTRLQRQGMRQVVYGDIFLEDLRAYREQQLARVPLQGVFPLWQRSSQAVLEEFWEAGFQAIVVCVNDRWLDKSFCGRLLDRDFVRDLPPGVDCCGENGEYHSFVFDAPYFSAPIAFERGEVVWREYQAPGTTSAGESLAAGFWYADLELK